MISRRVRRMQEGYDLLNNRDFQAALELFLEQQKLDVHEYPHLSIVIARCHIELNQLDKALPILKKTEHNCTRSIDKRDFYTTQSHYYQKLYLSKGKFNTHFLSEAISSILKVPNEYERHRLWRHALLLSLKGEKEEALAILDQGLLKYPHDKHMLTTQIKIAWHAFIHKNEKSISEEAARTLEATLQNDFSLKNHGSWLYIAHAYEQHNNFKKAEEIHLKILRINPEFFDAIMSHGLMLLISYNDPAQSIPYFEKITSSKNHFSILPIHLINAYHGLAYAHYALGERTKALAAIEEALLLNQLSLPTLKIKEFLLNTYHSEDKSEMTIPTKSTLHETVSLAALTQIFHQVHPLKQEIPTEFWKLIREGFTSGHGVDFLNALKNEKIYQTLFPSMNREHEKQNEEWFQKRVERLDEQFNTKKKAVFTLTPLPALYGIDVLLVVKELRSVDDIQKIHTAYQLTLPCDSKFHKEVQLKLAQKKQYFASEAKNEDSREKVLEKTHTSTKVFRAGF